MTPAIRAWQTVLTVSYTHLDVYKRQKELFVQPASGDNGTSLGAATYAAHLAGDTIQKMEHAYLGPAYTTEECIAACEAHPAKPIDVYKRQLW